MVFRVGKIVITSMKNDEDIDDILERFRESMKQLASLFDPKKEHEARVALYASQPPRKSKPLPRRKRTSV